MPQGQRAAWLGARGLAMTEIRCRRTGTLFLNSFWDGRLGQLAFEYIRKIQNYMSLQALEKPSNARDFFNKLTRDSNPSAAIQRLVNATPPVFESEWLDFKGAARIDDAGIKKTWSEALAGFATTQGGVLIWGVDARKDKATGIDAACGLSLVKNPSAFKTRLNELHDQATEPPVLGVETEAYPFGDSGSEGFVICFIPESPFKPHRAEYAGRQYFIRAGDDFVVPSISLLRNLFFPQSRCRLVPKVVQVDAANDLALLKADGKFSPLPIAASRSAHLGECELRGQEQSAAEFPRIGAGGFSQTQSTGHG